MSKFSDTIVQRFPYSPTAGQKKLFDMFEQLLNMKTGRPTLLLRGYAGTGKTTAIASLVRVLPSFDFHFILLAPTGRAAKVVSRYSGRMAFTIHKIIYRNIQDPETGELVFTRLKNYHKKTIFIVDESSMIQENTDQIAPSLLYDLISYVFENPSNKLILIGDDAQLPPVGYTYSGALDPYHLINHYNLDLIETELTEVVRQEMNSGILENATHVRSLLTRGDYNLKLKTKGFDDIVSISSEELEDMLISAYREHGLKDTVILCRSNREAVLYNQFIRKSLLSRYEELETGDMLMVVRNNYHWLPEDSKTGFLANGDFLEVEKIYKIEDKYGFRFANLLLRLADYPGEDPFEAKVILNTLNSSKPSLDQEDYKLLSGQVYADIDSSGSREKKMLMATDPYLNALQVKFTAAMTCHKSQGGQWKSVFIKPGFLANGRIDKEFIRWLYTAITRASLQCNFIDFSYGFYN